ncbi:glucokinase [Mycolicibacterium chitae]|uniref:Transcriptional regulator/sugar kinase n=1 Tax=Mycolicibacterium chitae TaxID=1792 RepID=A0A3S4SBQ7_MYCCI|nr:ROK family protein [Mycolicibacterium chitae]MCV7108481.1 ROK family protein [Mycolicibacterium chitae]BBZ00713.1 glucokinase [Mycolicibacterium chitae]VEG49562.1 transcriptional regulator/sugar kinase [Mycolicibacterium chitae]
MSELTLALDIGGTKIAAGLVDPDGTLVRAQQLPTPRGAGPEAVWRVVEQLIVGMTAETPVRGAGIASAGPIDLPAGTVSPINVPAWQGFPIRERVAGALGGLPVRLAGDGLCMALGEHWRGAGRDARFLLGLVVSTGVGGGLVLDGAPYAGRTGNAGHVGHVVVDPAGVRCTCGGHGCVETVAGGPKMVAWARENGWTAAPDADAAELSAAAVAGDAIAVRAFERGATAVAATIASVAAVCDLDRVVVGGGVARAGAVLFDPLRAALRRFAGLSFLADLTVRPARLGSEAGLVGAAALLRDT